MEPLVDGLDALVALVKQAGNLAVLTGAGISTDSGIPDYRDVAGEWKRIRPVEHNDFIASAATRQRYWARSMIGWSIMGTARPNAGHLSLASLERTGVVSTLITQNVDGLHQAAGSSRVIDLHGRIDQVICLGCAAKHPRRTVQGWLEAENPDFFVAEAKTAPDGDADLVGARYDAFRVPSCPDCRGVLKPDVVFFGDSVPKPRVAQAMAAVEAASALLVVGSSLMVYSGFRFCESARRSGKPIAAINLGRTRADDLLAVKIAAPCGDVLQRLVERLECAFR
jgi:NAD-dependent SIR2 family protein deacetylase